MAAGEDKAVLVTGASTGIGAACALRLDELGFRVFAGVRNDAAAQALRERASPALTPLMLDVTEPAAIAAAAEHIAAGTAGKGLHGLVNNAGVVIAGPIELLPLDVLRRQLEVNVVGLVAVTQAMLPLVRQARGRIVNIGADNGSMSPPFLGAYGASKHALEAINDSLRIEVRPFGIHVAIVEVGPTQTPIWEKSAAVAEQTSGAVSPERLELYRENVAAFRAAIAAHGAGSKPVASVVKHVVHALTSPRPWARYFTAQSSRFFYRGLRWLPVPWRDWFLRRALKMK